MAKKSENIGHADLTSGGETALHSHAGGDGLDSGLIVMWHGAIATIPAGYVICDGNNDTPNLLTRFVQGVATAATDPGTTGGATAKTTSGHQHDLPVGYYATGIPFDMEEFGTGDQISCLRIANTSTHSYSRPASLTKTKTDSITDIRPLFYDVAFIMKT